MSAPAAARPRWSLAASVLALALGACAAWLFAPVLHGYFLSDDFVPLTLFGEWQARGTLGSELAATFAGSLAAGTNHFYRPLSYLTFAASWLANGTHAPPWMAVNVLVHALNGLMAGAIGAFLAAERPGAREAAAGLAGAALFLFFAPGAEVLAWISGRFDGFATFFTLLACLAFVRSRRAWDAAAWVSLAAAAAAFLSKESAAIVPFAIALLALARPEALAAPTPGGRAAIALRRSWPWIAVAALYLAARYAMFGSATTVYGGSHPVAAAFSVEYASGLADTLPAWLEAQFRPSYRDALLGVLTALQLVLLAFPRRGEPRARAALAAVAGIVLLTLALVFPHVGALPPSGLGGRLLYQTAAFYAVLATIGLRHARLARLLWGTTLALAILHAAFLHEALGRWSGAYAQMRAVVAALGRLHAALAPGEYALAIVPAALDDVPFARNAQGGLMLPPVFDPPLSDRLLVQVDEEVPQVAGKVASGIVADLRAIPLLDYAAGRRLAGAPIQYPTRVVCWDPVRRALVPLVVPPGPSPEGWGEALRRAFAGAPCVPRTRPRR